MSAVILGKIRTNDTVSFDLKISTVLPQDFSYVKVLGVVPASVTHKFGIDAYALHAQAYRLLEQGSISESADNYSFLLVELQNGDIRAVGEPWILEDSIKVHTTNRVSFVVTDIDEDHIQQIKNTIARWGYFCEIIREDV